MVGPQAGLALRMVLHHKVHYGMALQTTAHNVQLSLALSARTFEW